MPMNTATGVNEIARVDLGDQQVELPMVTGTEQERPAATDGLGSILQLDTIVVSPTRTERPLFTTPAAVSRRSR